MNYISKNCLFVIMAGGKGERLWPLVRKNTPKVCIRPGGKEALLVKTIKRLKPLAGPKNTLIITTQEQKKPIQKILPGAWKKRLILEPEGKNTAACIALATALSEADDPEKTLIFLPADHWISNEPDFRKSLKAAIQFAESLGKITLIGIRAKTPNPGLGHICYDRPIGNAFKNKAFKLKKFIEKPSPRQSISLCKSKKFLWNSGIFVGKTALFKELIQKYTPIHSEKIFSLMNTRKKPGLRKRLKSYYRSLPAISFDHAVMTHIRDGIVIDGLVKWEDLGSWDSWIRVGCSSDTSYPLRNDKIKIVSTQPHFFARIGSAELIVVHTKDATLICDADKTQSVREIPGTLLKKSNLFRFA